MCRPTRYTVLACSLFEFDDTVMDCTSRTWFDVAAVRKGMTPFTVRFSIASLWALFTMPTHNHRRLFQYLDIASTDGGNNFLCVVPHRSTSATTFFSNSDAVVISHSNVRIIEYDIRYLIGRQLASTASCSTLNAQGQPRSNHLYASVISSSVNALVRKLAAMSVDPPAVVM